MRKLLLVSLFGFVGLSALAADPEPRRTATACEPNERGRDYENLPAPWARTTNSEIVHTRIGGRDFYVPRNYFRHPQIGCGVEETGMLLRVLLPDLKPYSEETAADFAAQRGHGRYVNILVSRGSQKRPLAELVGIFIEENAVQQTSPATYGLLHGRHRHGDDVFFLENDGNVVRVIRCRPVRPNRGASCAHHFRHSTHHVQLGYGREHLPEWQSIQMSVEKLLDSFREPTPR